MSSHHQPARSHEEQDLLLAWHQLTCEGAQLQSNTSQTAAASICPHFWDGILCWPPATPGIVHHPCPGYIAGFRIEMNATKVCDEEYHWSNWTNFTQCSDKEVTLLLETGVNITTFWEKYVPLVSALSELGFGISGVTLIIAFIILSSFKRLRCPRNKLHLHLFVSFIMRAFMGFLKRSIFEQGIAPQSDFLIRDGEKYFHQKGAGNLECKLLTTVWQYFIIANYSWVLMEGLYIHNVIMWALSADTSRILVYIILGWGFPLIITPIWAIARALWEDDLCWTVNKSARINYITQGPTVFSLVVNFMLFVNILRLLMRKVQTSIQEEAQRYWRLAKSTLVLLVLFGVPYLIFLTLYALPFGPEVHFAWLFLDQLFASFQGFIIALLYCFLNAEVQDELKKAWRECAGRGSLPENTLQTTSCASWSSAYSSSRAPSKCSRILRFLFPCQGGRSSHSTKRTDTVDCIVCEACGNERRNSKRNSLNENCPHVHNRDYSEVEMKLINSAKSTVSSPV